MARRKSSRTQLRLAGALLLLLMLGGIFGWWHLRHWQPAKAEYPAQGVRVSAKDGEVDWNAVKAIGAQFAYLDASASVFVRDPAFAGNLEEARAANLKTGAIHRYDPCQPAERQAANFVTVVPRDSAMLPPVVELEMLTEGCPNEVSDAKIETELSTFLNQVESHAGKPALLKLSAKFESRFGIAAKIDRNLWLDRTRLQPDYAGRPWTLWTANDALETEAGDNPLSWVVVQP